MKFGHVTAFIFFLVFENLSFSTQIYVKRLTGTEFLIDISLDATIEDLKEEVFKRTNIPVNQQRFIFAGKQLEDGRTLCDYDIQKDSILNLVLRLRGGGGNFQAIDVTKEWTRHEFGKVYVPHLAMRNGLSVLGECSNENCAVYDKAVISNLGFGKHELDKIIANCPVCGKTISAGAFQVTNCWYNVDAIKKKHKKII